jgi:glycerophosphoryl diester phosphodiesterase
MKKSFFLLIILSSCLSTQAPVLNEKVTIHGHRGARARFPENSLTAMNYALSVGVDYLESDMGITRDGVVVLNHDTTLNADLCLDKNKKHIKAESLLIKDLTLAELKEFDCGSLKNSKFSNQQVQPGEKIATLDELFELVKSSKYPAAKTVKFNLETKMGERVRFYDPDVETLKPELFVPIVLNVIKKHKMTDRVVIQSFDFRTLNVVRKLAPDIKISALTDRETDYFKIADDLKPNFLSPRWNNINAYQIKVLKEKGVEVIPWTVNNVAEWNEVLSMGARAIITDDPESLKNYVLSLQSSPSKN